MYSYIIDIKCILVATVSCILNTPHVLDYHTYILVAASFIGWVRSLVPSDEEKIDAFDAIIIKPITFSTEGVYLMPHQLPLLTRVPTCRLSLLLSLL
jgi:predicted neutral ceramidase superfamily lipid hydrolase